MARLINTLVIAGTLLPAVFAFNEIFGFSPSDPTCTACLDEVFESCPGDYKTRSYATCMCGGVGSTNFVGCTSNSCDPNVNSPNNAARMWYNYCTQFFPAEMCPDAEQYMNADIFQDQCSSEAIASGGLGSDEPSETGSPASVTETVSNTISSGASSPTGGSGTGGGGFSSRTTSSSGSTSGRPTPTASSPGSAASTGTGTGSATGSSSKPSGSSSANAAIIPAWGIFGALGVQLINMAV